MPDEKLPPPERPTARLDQEKIQTELLNKLLNNMGALTDKVDAVVRWSGTMTDQVQAIDSRLKAVEEQNASPVAIPRYSGRVAALEQNDVTVDQRLKSLEDKTDAQTVTLGRILGNPEVRKVLQSIAGLVIALSALGTWLAYQKLSAVQSRVEEQRQASPAVTVVPVFMPIVDAGGGSDAHP